MSALLPLIALLRRDARGVAAVEFGIVCMPLLLILFGSIEFARAYWTEEALANAASATARCMGLSLSSCSVSGAYSAAATQAYAQTIARKWGVTVATANITLTTATSCAGMTGSTSFNQVTITTAFSTYVSSLIPVLASKTLTAQACFPSGSA